MFITNPEIFDEDFFITFDKKSSDYLIRNGFCLFGIEDKKYLFIKSKKLMDFITLKGGERDAITRT